jgi:hypothetical protein
VSRPSDWRWLLKGEDGTFLELPALCRGTAAELLKITDPDTGVIVVGKTCSPPCASGWASARTSASR